MTLVAFPESGVPVFMMFALSLDVGILLRKQDKGEHADGRNWRSSP